MSKRLNAKLGLALREVCEFLLVVFIGVPGIGIAGQADTDSLPATQMIDAGGIRLETLIHGSGSPTVVFESGNIGGMEVWRPLQAVIGENSTTISYERAGLGESGESQDPRTAEQISVELRQLLESIGAPLPFVIVAHSAGAMYLMPFLAQQGKDIAGVVFVDPATPAIYEYMAQSQPERWSNYTAEVRKLYDPGPGWFAQWDVLGQSMDQAASALPLMTVPAVVMTALQPIEGEWPLDTSENMEVWLNSHKDLVSKLPNAEHVILNESDHGSILGNIALRDQVCRIISSVALANDEKTLRHFKTVLWPQAYRTRDVELLDSMLHESFEVIDDAGEVSTKQGEIDFISNNQWDPGSFEFRIERLDIYDGKVAIISGTGIASTYTYKSSNVLIKKDGEWKAISSHVSGYRDRDTNE